MITARQLTTYCCLRILHFFILSCFFTSLWHIIVPFKEFLSSHSSKYQRLWLPVLSPHIPATRSYVYRRLFRIITDKKTSASLVLVIYLGHIFGLFSRCCTAWLLTKQQRPYTLRRLTFVMLNNRQTVLIFLPIAGFGLPSLFVELTRTLLTLISDRPGDGVVSVVHGPVPQAGLPAADHRPWWRRAASRTRCRYADRRSVSDQRRRVCRPRSRLLDRLQRSPHRQYPLHCKPAQRRRRTSWR